METRIVNPKIIPSTIHHQPCKDDTCDLFVEIILFDSVNNNESPVEGVSVEFNSLDSSYGNFVNIPQKTDKDGKTYATFKASVLPNDDCDARVEIKVNAQTSDKGVQIQNAMPYSTAITILTCKGQWFENIDEVKKIDIIETGLNLE